MNDKKWIKELKVGDKVFVVENFIYSNSARKDTETVTKVGTKYLTINDRRKVEIKSGMEKRDVNTGISYSEIYPNEEHYLKKLELQENKKFLSEFFKSSKPTAEIIEQVYKIVKNSNTFE